MQAGSRGQSRYARTNTTPLATHFRGITVGARFNTAEDDHFASVNLTSVLYKARIDDAEHVKMEVWHAPGRTKPSFSEAKRAKYQPLKKGDSFGPSWTNHWVRVHLQVPREFQEEERVQLEFDSSCEAMVYSTEGLPLQGLTGGFNDERRVEFIIKSPKAPQTFYIEVSANELFGIAGGQDGGPGPNVYFKLEGADIVVPRMEAWHLLWDFRILKDLARALPSDSRLGSKAMYTANAMLNVFRHDDLYTIDKARQIAESVLGKGWQSRGTDVYEQTKDEQIYAMSNCHIDTAWLWPFSVTQQKTARSWSTQCDLMDRYPEHRFVASQAQQFKWLEEQYPMLFDVIRQKVEEGKFMPIGGSWVENDTNMPAGEALCRQMIFGQRYFKSRFGKYCDVHWLPDTFGYSSQLPQICRLAGMDFFFTQKLSWSQFNKFPHSTFNWVGIDGSQVLTHMTPADTYNAQCMPEEIINGVKNLKNLEVSDISLLPFGNGDGGGGAVPPMLERLRRLRSIANNNPELPKVGYGNNRSVSDMYHAILRQTDDGKMLPTWMGELYLEFHRGTYTSHGSIKRHNRKSEILLKELEYLATLASLQGKTSAYVYPKSSIDPLWEKVLLCQFHDVLPGSAIGMVYEDAEKIYAEVYEKATDLLREAIKALIPSSSHIITPQHDLIAINTIHTSRCEIVHVPDLPWAGGSYLATQKQDQGFLTYAHDVNGCGIAKLIRTAPEVPATCSYKDGEYSLTNESLEVKVNSSGRITSVVDLREDRQLISPGRSAGFVIFEDTPGSFDAWDHDIYALETATQLRADSVRVKQAGPLRASVICQYRLGDSTWSTTISIDAIAASEDAMSMIDIDTNIDWRARHRFLKWEAPVEIFSSEAFYETQFGYLSRPTHRNTSWDAAKFEVCGHKYIDLSEHGYGIALLNDCKYGFAVCGNVMRISLLRSATGPDPEQDQGKHQFKFAFLPHKEHFYQTRVPQIAAAYNAPMRIQAVAAGASQNLTTPSIVRVEGAPSVVLDTIKRGEDDDFMSKEGQTSVILRFYESKGGQAKARLSFGSPITSARIVDLLERPLADVELKTNKNGSLTAVLSFRGFEVKTLQLLL